MEVGVIKILLKFELWGLLHKQIGTKKQGLLEWIRDEKAQQKYLEYGKNVFIPENDSAEKFNV